MTASLNRSRLNESLERDVPFLDVLLTSNSEREAPFGAVL